jgi:hypothetical protein
MKEVMAITAATRMAGGTGFGDPPWCREDLLSRLEEFSALYESRPVQDNAGGMSSTHMFLFWFLMQWLKPRVVIESGVWQGLGTWFIEKGSPDADIYCIDIDWSHLKYRSDKARYLSEDFSQQDWSRLNKTETLVFFDDHVNALERLRQCVALGFRHLVFEDNYPPGTGDCYSLKKVLMHAGHKGSPRVQAALRRLLGKPSSRSVSANAEDAAYVRQHAEVVSELPPIFKLDKTRWGTPWDARYPTLPPLLSAASAPSQRRYRDEAEGYTWLCYVRLGARR